MEKHHSKTSKFSFFRIVLSIIFFGTLAILLIIPFKSLWGLIVGFTIFLFVEFINFLITPTQDPDQLSDLELVEYLKTYLKLRNCLIFSGLFIVFCFWGILFSSAPFDAFFKLFTVINLIYLVFYAPILIYYVAVFASKRKIIAQIYLQRSTSKSQEQLIHQEVPHQLSPVSTQSPNPTPPNIQHTQTSKKIEPTKQKKRLDIELQLQKYASSVQTSLLPRHNRLIERAQDTFKYIAFKKETITVTEAYKVKRQQEKTLNSLQQTIQLYLTIPINERHQYNSQLNAIPNLWLTQELNSALEKLIHNIAFLYQDNLQALADHQQFLNQRFNDAQEDFKIETDTTKY